MKTFSRLALLLFMLASPLQAATVTTKFPLTNAGWTDLGAGPLLLSFTGQAVYAIADTVPTTVPPPGEGFVIPNGGSVSLSTSSHVWAMAQGTAGANAYAAPVTLAGANGGSYTLGEAGLPFVYPSSGSMGANGALTMTTALDVAYPNAYIYMPASAISAGSAAGWYYGQCASVTVCTLFNNVYATGTPKIPSPATPFVTTGPGAYTQTISANINAWQTAVPGNAMGLNGAIQLTVLETYANSAGSKTLNVFFGGGVVASGAVTTTHQQAFQTLIRNRGVANSQITGATNITLSYTALAGAIVLTAADTTVNQTLSIQINMAVATDYLVLQSVTAVMLPGV